MAGSLNGQLRSQASSAASRDDQGLAGDIAGVFGDQEGRRAGDLVRVADALNEAVVRLQDVFIFPQSLAKFGLDDAGSD